MSQTLHTVSPYIVAALIDGHLESNAPSQTHTCVRRVLTALIHHCRGADQFTPAADVLASHLDTTTSNLESEPSIDYVKLVRMLDILSVACSVRQGSRLTGTSDSWLYKQNLISVKPNTCPSLQRRFHLFLRRPCLRRLFSIIFPLCLLPAIWPFG